MGVQEPINLTTRVNLAKNYERHAIIQRRANTFDQKKISYSYNQESKPIVELSGMKVAKTKNSKDKNVDSTYQKVDSHT